MMSTANTNQATYPEPSLSNYDLTSMAKTQFQQLEALFKAIRRAKDDHRQELAEIGMYLCQDWVGIYDCEHEAIEHSKNNPNDKLTTG